jgi:hypothetical protein
MVRLTRQRCRSLVFGCILAWVYGCSGSPTRPSVSTPRSELTYSRPAAELIGPESGSYTRANAAFEGRTGLAGGFNDPYLRVAVSPFTPPICQLYLAAPRGFPLQVGTYSGATRWPFQSPNAPGMDFSCGLQCNTLEGNFVVRELEIDAAGILQRIDVSFEQRCTNQSRPAALLTGTLRVYPGS